MPGAKNRVPKFTVAREGDGSGNDSDEEGVKLLQTAQAERAAQSAHRKGNVTQQELAEGADVYITEAKSKKRIKLTMSNRDDIICAVCGQSGHTAGFVGAVYVDCPVKPCYLCKKAGHTAATCPFRLDPTLQVQPAAGTSKRNIASFLDQRQHCCLSPAQRKPRNIPRRKHNWKIRSACLKLFSRRVTALEFPPGSTNLVCSADKKGHIGVWDFDEVTERTVFENVHEYQINAMQFLPGHDGLTAATASCDGHVCVLDIETGCHYSMLNLNPGGWVSGVSNEKNWNMVQSVTAFPRDTAAVWAGDNRGQLFQLDLRSKSAASRAQIHLPNNKVTSLAGHPIASHLLLTASNDHLCKLFDIRMLKPEKEKSARGKPVCAPLLSLEHPRVISSATFSPQSGTALLTTCGDNRLRVWDDVSRADSAPSRELVHSHDFNRYLSPFKAVWDPKDSTERTIVIGRYISEDHGGTVLHPIDILDAGTGALVDSLIDPNLQLINPVNAPHPFLDVIITGSSGNLYCWRPEEDEEADDVVMRTPEEDAAQARALDDAGDALRAGAGPLQGSHMFTLYDVASQEKKAQKKKKPNKGAPGSAPPKKGA